MQTRIISKILCILFMTTILSVSAVSASSADWNVKILGSKTYSATDIVNNANRTFKIAVAKIGDKTFAYTATGLASNNTGAMISYDVTDLSNIKVLENIPNLTGFASDCLAIKDGYLIITRGGSPNGLRTYKIGSDGKLNITPTQTINIGTITNIHMVDETIMTVDSNQGLIVLNISNMANVTQITRMNPSNTSDAKAPRASGVEKLSPGSYRISVFWAHPYSTTIDGNPYNLNETFAIYDVTISPVSVTERILGKPSGTPYPGLGSFSSVTGLAANWGDIDVIGENTILVSTGSADFSNIQLVIDTEDPADPKIIGNYRPVSASKVISLPGNTFLQLNSASGSANLQIFDYTADMLNRTEELSHPFSFGTMAASDVYLFENTIFTTHQSGSYSQINAIKLRDDYSASPLTLNNGTASVFISNNLSSQITLTLVTAIYDDDKMVDVHYTVGNVPGNEQSYEITSAVNIPTDKSYTVKAWLMDNFYGLNLLSELCTN